MSLPSNLTGIDRLGLPDHRRLNSEDDCAFLGECTAYKGYNYSETNRLIFNLKKGVDKRGTPEWKHKKTAILEAAAALRKAIRSGWFNSAIFVPIPPSRMKTDPMHDDRMSRIPKEMDPGNPVDWQEIICQTKSTTPAHDSKSRPTPDELLDLYKIDETQCNPSPKRIVIVDDVVTADAHYRAAHRIISERLGSIRIVGVFIARFVPGPLES